MAVIFGRYFLGGNAICRYFFSGKRLLIYHGNYSAVMRYAGNFSAVSSFRFLTVTALAETVTPKYAGTPSNYRIRLPGR